MDLLAGRALQVALYWLVLGVPVGYWVYTDARKRAYGHPRAWGVGMGLLGVVGALVYLGYHDRLG